MTHVWPEAFFTRNYVGISSVKHTCAMCGAEIILTEGGSAPEAFDESRPLVDHLLLFHSLEERKTFAEKLPEEPTFSKGRFTNCYSLVR